MTVVEGAVSATVETVDMPYDARYEVAYFRNTIEPIVSDNACDFCWGGILVMG
jgi:hypothetical protein